MGVAPGIFSQNNKRSVRLLDTHNILLQRFVTTKEGKRHTYVKKSEVN